MKKILALLWIFALCLGLLLYSIFDTAPQSAQTPTDGPVPVTTEKNNDEPEPSEDPVQIRVEMPDPEKKAVWEQIAAEYTEDTGVEILLMDKTMAQSPTLYTVDDLQKLGDPPCQDLSDTVAYAQLADMGLTLTVEGKIVGVAAEVECFGLIYNTDLLIAAGYTPSDIYDAASFSTVVQGIGRQGYTAFAGRGLDDGVAVRLASIPGNIHTLAQLWVEYSSKETEERALERFVDGESVFYLGSTAEYDTITEGGVKNLGILPIFLDEPRQQMQSLCVTALRYWCVSSDDPEQTAAAKAFLDYLITADAEGLAPVDRLEMLAPYRQATYYANPLEAVLRQDLNAGKGYLVCPVMDEPPAGFIEALMTFAKDPTDENWALVQEKLQ